MDFRDIAFPSLRSIRAAAVDLLTIIQNRRLDRGDTDPACSRAAHSQVEVMDALGNLERHSTNCRAGSWHTSGSYLRK